MSLIRITIAIRHMILAILLFATIDSRAMTSVSSPANMKRHFATLGRMMMRRPGADA
jgi:hypothetical protein